MGKQKGETGKKVRPSSSSLAASLLPSGPSTIGFGGYVGSSRLVPGEDSPPVSGVDGDVAQHLKRLGRKDPTTKIKALTSLSALFEERSGEEVTQVIPQWAFEYKRLLLDYNREVRRASNETMTSLVSTVRRGLAPHLKSLMGPWWFSQFDPVPEVSQAARQSLQVAFPAAEKRLDALILCANEIFLYLDENLKLTPQAMSDKAVPLDELEDMHRRVISSSLLALATIIDILLGIESAPDLDHVTAEYKRASKAKSAAISSAERIFLSHKYFLGLFKSEVPGIRSSTYSVLACFIKHIPHLFNEGNMKILSASILGAFEDKNPTCHSSMWHMILLFSNRFPESWSLTNVQKNILSQLWPFLRNGCYGSLQVSYQHLIPFLETVPPQVVAGGHFLLNFFQNLWTGRKVFYLPADLPVFFKALKECYLWAIHNASRYVGDVDGSSKLQNILVEQIFLKLLWHEFLISSSPKDVGGLLSGEPEITSQNDGHEKPIESRNIKYSSSYIQELGKCIVDILSDIHLKEPILIGSFCGPVLKCCLEIFESREPSQHVEQIMQFFILLKQHIAEEGETWPLVALAGPLAASSFELIKSVDSPDGIRLLSVIVTVFGPRTVITEFVHGSELQLDTNISSEDADRLLLDYFWQVFTNDLVPWSLDKINDSTGSRLDLLLALLDEELFLKQWCTIVTYAAILEGCEGSCLDLDRIAVLTMLLEKVRARNKKNNMSAELWNHELLDKAAISIICQHCSFNTTHTRFLWAVLGGSQKDGQDCFLSGAALTFVLEEMSKKLALFLVKSCLSWVKQASSLILCSEAGDLEQNSTLTLSQIKEDANFVLEVLDRSFFCLKILDGDSDIVPSILSAVLIIAQEGEFLSQIEDTTNLDLDGTDVLKLQLRKLIHAFLAKLNREFCKSLTSHSIKKLQDILVQAIRCILFDRDAYAVSKTPDFCSNWTLTVLELTCHDYSEEQIVLDHVLSDAEYWPQWVALDATCGRRSASLKVESTHSDVQEFGHRQFVVFADKLISSLGAERVFGGSVLHAATDKATIMPASPLASYSRAWLAAELLCTWEWQGGSALECLLPFLRVHAKIMHSSYEESLICSVIDILLEGTIIHGPSYKLKFFNAWSVMDNEVENLQDPFLRGLISLFSVLIKENVWEKGDIFSLFEHLLQRLLIGTTINRNCLRILPFVLNVIMRPLLSKSSCEEGTSNAAGFDSSKEEQVHDTVSNWLESALSLPPLALLHPEQEKTEEWIQLVVSCFPLNPTGGLATLESAYSREISQSHKKLLLDLFRKNRCHAEALAESSNMETPVSKSGKMILLNLMAVSLGYCWQDFGEEDLDFLLGNIRYWIQAAVVPIEELTEKISESVTKSSSSDNFEGSAKVTEEALQVLDHSLMDFSRTPLFMLSLLCGITEFRQAQDFEISHWLKSGKQAHVKDRILEDVLRLFFATGIAEAISSAYGGECPSIIASARLKDFHFWDLVAFNVINSPDHVRRTATKAVELWSLSKGAIDALYAILFSSRPIAALQVAAYNMLSNGPIDHIVITKEDNTVDRLDQSMLPSEEPFRFREEISYLIEKVPSELDTLDLAERTRVYVFLAWALLLTHLQSLSSSSSSSLIRKKLVQCVQESASSSILDCIFQHIPLKCGPTNISRKKEVELLPEISQAAVSAKRAITTGSLLFAVECLCPVGNQEMASLAGAIYGLMLRLLPTYVCTWFAGLRDRVASSAIESFTKAWCSPPLLADELSQIKGAVLTDENFSVSVSKSPCEVTATYRKEESGMDLVLQLPSCYPLRPVDVSCTRSLGISEVKHRKWLLSMAALLRNQNGALAEAIRIWRSNFDKEFEGVEECPICYSIINASNHSRPQLACKTCKYKFHSACLYKWFSTSHKSTCPLCQTPF